MIGHCPGLIWMIPALVYQPTASKRTPILPSILPCGLCREREHSSSQTAEPRDSFVHLYDFMVAARHRSLMLKPLSRRVQSRGLRCDVRFTKTSSCRWQILISYPVFFFSTKLSVVPLSSHACVPPTMPNQAYHLHGFCPIRISRLAYTSTRRPSHGSRLTDSGTACIIPINGLPSCESAPCQVSTSLAACIQNAAQIWYSFRSSST